MIVGRFALLVSASGAAALQLSALSAPSTTSARASAVRLAVDDKAEVKEYFNNAGFDRWSRIYSEDGEVNSVQLDIRTGHAQTVDKVLGWVDADGSAKGGETFCEAMAGEAAQRAAAAGVAERATFSTSDLEAIS